MLDATLQALAAPFEPSAVRWKAQAVKGDRALAVAYIDARTVMARLDEVLGLAWSDNYEFHPDGSVVCRLEITVEGRRVERCDVGGNRRGPDDRIPSEKASSGDGVKAAVSDALKRAAIKFGVGRYLYHLPKVWVDYDPQKKQLKGQPQLPPWAMPAKASPAAGSDEVDLGRVTAITHQQAEVLQQLLQANRSIDPAKFLARFKAGRLSEIPAQQYTAAVTVLKTAAADVLRNGKQPA